MILDTTTLYLYVETPLHAGTGSGLSSVDLPIQRERTTQYPMIQGSGIKGKLRSAAFSAQKEDLWKSDEIDTIFGPDINGAEYAGALIIGDARLLLFPVRSLNGVFAYTTSFDILNRFLRDRKRGESEVPWEISTDVNVEPSTALVPQKNVVTPGDDNTLVLEEFSFSARKNSLVDMVAKWIAENALPQNSTYKYWRDKVKTSLVILSNNDFRDFVVNATEIITRIRLKRETKTVDGGMLWTEEHLPTDTLLYVPIYATNARKQQNGSNGKSEPAMSAASILAKARTLEQSQHGYLQLGGDETVGRGMVCMHWEAAKDEGKEQ